MNTYVYKTSKNRILIVKSDSITDADKKIFTLGVSPQSTIVHVESPLQFYSEFIVKQNESYHDKNGEYVEDFVDVKKYLPDVNGKYFKAFGEFFNLDSTEIYDQ